MEALPSIASSSGRYLGLALCTDQAGILQHLYPRPLKNLREVRGKRSHRPRQNVAETRTWLKGDEGSPVELDWACILLSVGGRPCQSLSIFRRSAKARRSEERRVGKECRSR